MSFYSPLFIEKDMADNQKNCQIVFTLSNTCRQLRGKAQTTTVCADDK